MCSERGRSRWCEAYAPGTSVDFQRARAGLNGVVVPAVNATPCSEERDPELDHMCTRFTRSVSGHANGHGPRFRSPRRPPIAASGRSCPLVLIRCKWSREVTAPSALHVRGGDYVSTMRFVLPLGCDAPDCRTRAALGDHMLLRTRERAEEVAQKFRALGYTVGEPEEIDLGYDPDDIRAIGGFAG